MLGCEHAENPSTAAHVENDLVLEQVAVLLDGLHVGLGANSVLEHFLMDSKVAVRVKVVIDFGLGLGAIRHTSSTQVAAFAFAVLW